MNLLQRLEHWGDTHHPRWLDIVRIALGVFLMYRGVVFLENMSSELGRIANSISFNSFTLLSLGHFVVFAHLLGGLLLATGVLTRFACLVQIPVLLCAIVFVNAPQGLWTRGSELPVSIVVLLLLIYFLIAGNGQWSLNRFVQEEKKSI
jgi:putative oxidoreductase